MQNNSPIILRPKLKAIRREGGSPPPGAVFLGNVNGQRFYLTTRDRSLHLVIIGATGTGKTVCMENMIRQDIVARRGLCLIDPMGALFERILAFYIYRRAIGCHAQELIIANFSDGSWVLPFNPWARREGELSVQVDRRVAATVRIWGVSNSDQTPRLEKWLKVLYFALMACDLTIMEAGLILDQHAHEVRAFLLRGLKDGIIRRKLEQLSVLKSAEFLEQTESVENRLMRFLTSEHLARIFGTGANALDVRSLMDERKILLVNLQPSKNLSEEQARLIGTLLLNEEYEESLNRPTGARPFYCYVDEAAKFVSREVAQGTEQCRQKGLHFTFAFQHLAQFKEDGERVYKAFKHIRNKLVFAIPERQDALELADDLFVGLAEPEAKYTRRHLNHLIEDIRDKSITHSDGWASTRGQNKNYSQARTFTRGNTIGDSYSTSSSVERGDSFGRTFTRGKTSQKGQSSSHSRNQHESHSRGFSETSSREQALGHNASESNFRRDAHGFLFGETEQRTSETKGQTETDIRGHSRTDTGSDTYESGESWTEGQESSEASSRTFAVSKVRQQSITNGNSRGNSFETIRSQARSKAQSFGRSQERTQSGSRAVTDQPGTRHTAFWEETPEHYTLEEQRWRASELLMIQQLGQWFFRGSSTLGFGYTPLPQRFYIRPKQRLQLTNESYQAHNILPEEAERLLFERQQRLKIAARGPDSEHTNDDSGQRDPSAPIWDRSWPTVSSRPNGQRGPKTDIENHRKVWAVVKVYGESWANEEALREICEQLDKQNVPIPKTWPLLRHLPARSWQGALTFHADLVKKAIRYHCKAGSDLGLQ